MFGAKVVILAPDRSMAFVFQVFNFIFVRCVCIKIFLKMIVFISDLMDINFFDAIPPFVFDRDLSKKRRQNDRANLQKTTFRKNPIG